MKACAGIDLHSSNNYIGIINEVDKRLYHERHTNNLNEILYVLEPFKDTINGIAVEFTYNWYWLVDGLIENGYKVHLSKPSAVKQYEGLNNSHISCRLNKFSWCNNLSQLNKKLQIT